MRIIGYRTSRTFPTLGRLRPDKMTDFTKVADPKGSWLTHKGTSPE